MTQHPSPQQNPTDSLMISFGPDNHEELKALIPPKKSDNAVLAPHITDTSIILASPKNVGRTLFVEIERCAQKESPITINERRNDQNKTFSLKTKEEVEKWHQKHDSSQNLLPIIDWAALLWCPSTCLLEAIQQGNDSSSVPTIDHTDRIDITLKHDNIATVTIESNTTLNFILFNDKGDDSTSYKYPLPLLSKITWTISCADGQWQAHRDELSLNISNWETLIALTKIFKKIAHQKIPDLIQVLQKVDSQKIPDLIKVFQDIDALENDHSYWYGDDIEKLRASLFENFNNLKQYSSNNNPPSLELPNPGFHTEKARELWHRIVEFFYKILGYDFTPYQPLQAECNKLQEDYARFFSKAQEDSQAPGLQP